MASSIDLADYEWLIGPGAADLLADLADTDQPLHALASRLRRELSSNRVHLLLEQVDLRNRATAKFPHADRMFFTRLGLEQATDAWIARYKAARFAGRDRIADLCCGIGGDLLALAEFASVHAVDRDPVATCFAAANVQSVLPPSAANRVTLETTEIQRLRFSSFSAFDLDPDRRPTGKRTSSIDAGSPSLAEIDRLLADVPHAAIKLAPAADVPDAWSETCELEWISRDRECRQLVAWHGDLAHSPGQRRATLLETDGAVRRTLVGQPNMPTPTADHLEHYVFEPDPAILAAHLTGALATEHNLSAVSPGVAYLTGPTPVSDPALACFEIDDILPLNLRQLSSHLRERHIGRLEIKKRGVDHDPAVVHKALRLSGDNAATLLLTKHHGKHIAILAHRTEKTWAVPPLTPAS